MREREESSSNAHSEAASKRSLARYFGISEETDRVAIARRTQPAKRPRGRRSGGNLWLWPRGNGDPVPGAKSCRPIAIPLQS
jgi:hypothetical protein